MRPWLTVVAVLLWLAAAPPGWFPGAGWLILPAVGAFYALATSWARPYRMAYLVGLVHVLGFSWSLRHVVVGGYVAVGVLGAVYYLLTVLVLRAWQRWRVPGPIAFGLAMTVTQWLRAHMPEIPYPHGQSIHSLYLWPEFLGTVRWGGEPLGNLLLASSAAAAVDLWRSWRTAVVPWRTARAVAAVTWSMTLLLTVVGPPAAEPRAAAEPVDVVAVQPNLHPATLDAEGFRQRILEPSLAVAGPGVADPPDLLLWPETSYPGGVDARGETPRREGPRIPLARGTRLVAGAMGWFADGRRTPVAMALDARSQVVGVHEKRALVPAGEYVPLIEWLPAAWGEGILDSMREVFGVAPDFSPGAFREPMQTADGTRFGALLCYDNAFPAIARELVDHGATFLVVLSNEAWYSWGDELDQLVAISVCRALETGTPLVRCTADGLSVVVAADGHLGSRLARGSENQPSPEILRTEVVPGPGALPPLAWLHGMASWLAAVSGLVVLAHFARFLG